MADITRHDTQNPNDVDRSRLDFETARASDRLAIAPHACVRWQERVQPEASREESERALRRLIARGDLSFTCPDWLGARTARRPGTWYVTSAGWPGVVAIGDHARLRTVVSNRRPGESGRVGATVRFVGFEALLERTSDHRPEQVRG
jgi:hypothetical protein